MAEQDPQAGDTGPPKGIPALKAHVIANKVDVALWGIRLLTVLCTIGYVLPIFNNPVSAFYKALLGNAATSALRLHQRIPPHEISLSREFLNRFFCEDSAHYLFYSLIFMNVAPNLLILTPIFLFALLHAASYSLTILDTLGQNSMWVARLLISLVEFQSRNILRAAALAEIVLFPIVTLMAFVWWLLRAADAVRVLLLRDVALHVAAQPLHAQHVPRAARAGRALRRQARHSRCTAERPARGRGAGVPPRAAHGGRAAVRHQVTDEKWQAIINYITTSLTLSRLQFWIIHISTPQSVLTLKYYIFPNLNVYIPHIKCVALNFLIFKLVKVQ